MNNFGKISACASALLSAGEVVFIYSSLKGSITFLSCMSYVLCLSLGDGIYVDEKKLVCCKDHNRYRCLHNKRVCPHVVRIFRLYLSLSDYLFITYKRGES